VLVGTKLQRFLCCCKVAERSAYVLFPLMLIAAEMCDKTQIVAVAMAPSYGFQSIVIGGIFAQFFSICLACFCATALADCVKNEKYLNIFCAIMFLIFGLYELIGEVFMETSNQWAERKV
jgi:putative Ca2+/H+ antiporter (TMEM165/GDT1 family)